MCRNIRCFLLLSMLFLLTACGPNLEDILAEKLSSVESQLEDRKNDLQRGAMFNAELLKSYARQVAQIRPDMATAIGLLEKEAGVDGRLYQDLQQRYQFIKSSKEPAENLVFKADDLIKATSYDFFNDALVDPVNVLADLSNEKLPRVSVMSKSREAEYNDAKNYGSGQQLVGNPAYGQWMNSGGTSIWEWYGMYALFSNLMGGNRIFYNDWNRYRPYSHYQDRILDRYDYGYQRGTQSTYRKSSKYGSTPGGRKTSSYSRGSGVAKASTKSSSSSSHSSPYKSSSYSGNLRKSSSYSSGFRGGK